MRNKKSEKIKEETHRHLKCYENENKINKIITV